MTLSSKRSNSQRKPRRYTCLNTGHNRSSWPKSTGRIERFVELAEDGSRLEAQVEDNPYKPEWVSLTQIARWQSGFLLVKEPMHGKNMVFATAINRLVAELQRQGRGDRLRMMAVSQFPGTCAAQKKLVGVLHARL